METAVLEERALAPERAAASPRRGRAWPTLLLLGLTTFWGAALLFLVEPMVAKMLLPSLGGSAAVWNTAMVFFQAALLLGYGLTHVASRLRLRRHRALQVLLVSLVVASLPIALPAWHPPTTGSPALWVLAALAVAVGLPFVVLATTGPTLQSWLARSDHPAAAQPYVLYAMSNAGSLLALLAYPLVVEPRYGLATQARLWSVGYGGFAALFVLCALVVRGHRVAAVSRTLTPARLPIRLRLRWVWMAFVPSALLLGVTRHISTDVAAIPLVWIVPLALYLLSFVVAFGRQPDRVVTFAGRALKLLVIPVALTFASAQSSIVITIALDLAVFAMAALLCHGRLSQERPAPERLTSFYLCLSVGGVLGGIAAGLLAPLLFRSILEFPLALICAIALRPRENDGALRRRPLAMAAFSVVLVGGGVALAHSQTTPRDLTIAIALLGTAAVIAYVASRGPLAFAAAVALVVAVATQVHPEPVLAQSRTFFGVHRVQRGVHGEHLLVDGTTTHGIEYLTGPKTGRPEGYYARTEPIGQYLAGAAAEAAPRRVGIIGLGSGALAAYGRAGDAFTYYEIDPSIVRIANDQHLFTFLHDTKASVRTVVGDGRLTLGADTAARYDTLVIDAFSSDAIPTHLLTAEAMDLYRQHLAPGGVVAFHISNRHFDLAPVLQALARHEGLVARIQTGPGTSADPDALSSTWVLLAADTSSLPTGSQWQPLTGLRQIRLWTDEYSNPVAVLRW